MQLKTLPFTNNGPFAGCRLHGTKMTCWLARNAWNKPNKKLA